MNLTNPCPADVYAVSGTESDSLPDRVDMGVFDWQRLIRGSGLRTSVRAVAWAMSLYAAPNGNRAWPGIDRLIADTGLSRATVQRHLSTLRAAGYLRVVKQGDRYRHHSDEYQLTWQPPRLVDKPADNPVDTAVPEPSARKSMPHLRQVYTSSRSSLCLTGEVPTPTESTTPVNNNHASLGSKRYYRKSQVVDGQLPIMVSVTE